MSVSPRKAADKAPAEELGAAHLGDKLDGVLLLEKLEHLRRREREIERERVRERESERVREGAREREQPSHAGAPCSTGRRIGRSSRDDLLSIACSYHRLLLSLRAAITPRGRLVLQRDQARVRTAAAVVIRGDRPT